MPAEGSNYRVWVSGSLTDCEYFDAYSWEVKEEGTLVLKSPMDKLIVAFARGAWVKVEFKEDRY